jgi:hypothetical protein
MENSIYEMFWFFVIGMAGSATQLFILLMVSGDIRIIRNKMVRERPMAILFILVGGFVTLLFSLSLQQGPLVPSAAWKVFLAGLGWQGVVVSYAIGRKAEAGENAIPLRDSAARLTDTNKQLFETLASYMKPQLG